MYKTILLIKSVQDDIVNPQIPLKKVPEFKKCNFSSPLTYDSHGNRRSTKTYDLQCRQEDGKTMIEILMKTYAKNLGLVFHKIRHAQGGTELL